MVAWPPLNLKDAIQCPSFDWPAVRADRDALTAATDALEMPKTDLRALLRAGQSLRDVATTKGVDYATVSAAVSAADASPDLMRSGACAHRNSCL